MSDPKKESPYANIDMAEYTKRMQENREKYPPKKEGMFGGIKNIFLWWLNIGASFMGLDKKNILADSDPTTPEQNPYAKDHSAGVSFKASHRVETPPKPTVDQVEEMLRHHRLSMQHVDGKGDDDCKCK